MLLSTTETIFDKENPIDEKQKNIFFDCHDSGGDDILRIRQKTEVQNMSKME